MILFAVVVAALAFPLGVLAAHNFDDVPVSHTFHDHIDAIADAGVTAGCGDGNYCPSDPVTRAQMAGFFTRGLSRAAMSTTNLDFSIVADDEWATVASVPITVGGVSGTQFVQVYGEVTVAGNLIGCVDDCNVNARLRHAETGTVSTVGYYRFPAGAPWQDVVNRTWIYPAASGSNTFELQVRVFNTPSTLGISGPTLTATTHAFGATGGSTLSLSEVSGGGAESSAGGDAGGE